MKPLRFCGFLLAAIILAAPLAFGGVNRWTTSGPFGVTKSRDGGPSGTISLGVPSGLGPAERDGGVRALFDLDHPETGPFPSDIFTVTDPTHNTGRRLNLPYPDCGTRVSDCDDLDVVNTLDGFGLQTRISIPFSDDIDPRSITSDSVFIVSLGSTLSGEPPGGDRIGINQIVWDPATLMIHAEVDELLDQHRRYAVIVTKDVRDAQGRKVKKSSSFIDRSVPGWYRDQLDEAFDVARDLGTPPGQIIAASVFTTQTITSVMERIRDDIKAGTPASADFRLGPMAERAVFARTQVAGIVWRTQTAVSPPGFVNTPISLAPLENVPGSVDTIAFGRFVSPDYTVHPGEYIPAVGTLADTPPIQRFVTQYFTLFLPSGSKPANGWPIALMGSGATGNQHQTSSFYASKLAANGVATIGINHYGQGFGPLTTLTVTRTDTTTIVLPDAGRGIDQNGDNVIGVAEGSDAAPPRLWTIQQRDAHRQTVIDFMQLVRVIEVGMDVDGDSRADIDPSRIYFAGLSAGPMIGTILLALDPSIAVGAFASAPGLTPESVRWQPIRRSVLGANLASRTPSLINSPGLTAIDGIPTPAPHYNENKPLRNQPTVINSVVGAMPLQQALEFAEMVEESGLTPVTWARYLRASPLLGLYPKSVIFQFAKGDQQAVNPGTTAIIRAGNLADRTLYYRHDLAFTADPTMPKNPHLFGGMAHSPNLTFRAVARGAQDQIGAFFASDGATMIHPEPAQYFEVPISGPLPETLNFIP